MILRSVVVFGGTGFIGRHVVRQLVARGLHVRVPTRNRERVKDLILLPTVDVVPADVHDETTVQRLVDRADAVINLVGILHGDFQRAHVELAGKVVTACATAGVSRLVHMSSLKASAEGPSAYQRSKAQAERLVASAQGERFQITILRPSVVFGREDRFLNLFAKLARMLPVIALASPNARFQPIYVGDVARAIVSVLDDPRTFGQAYELCGPRVYTLRQLVDYVVRALGLRRPIIGLNQPLSTLQATILERLPGKLMTRDNLLSMKVDNVCDCPFPEVFAFSPTPLEAIVPTYIAGVTPRSRYRWFRYRARR